jgi:hypothetical protein
MPRALTLAEAASRLGVKPQRISQMLRSGDLSGPIIEPGRAPKGVGRVWESSLQREIDKRLAGIRRSRRPMTLDGDVQTGSPARKAAALEAVLQMKVRLDDAREALRDERQANKRLTNMLAAVVAELKAAHARSERLDNIAEGYSEALAQLIIPDGPSGASELPNRMRSGAI